MKKERKEIIPDEKENLIWAEDQVENMNVKRLSLRCLGKGETLFCREKSGRNKEKNVSNMVAQTNHQITNYVVENKLTW